eukprot:3061338-Rhodomonas_salina.1
MFSIFIAIVGTVAFSVCMGNLSSLASQNQGLVPVCKADAQVTWGLGVQSAGVTLRFEEKQRIIKEWLDWRQCPSSGV